MTRPVGFLAAAVLGVAALVGLSLPTTESGEVRADPGCCKGG